jgi:hypothetical protein
MLLKLFHEMEWKGILPYSFYIASITLIPKLDKDTIKKRENYRVISLINTQKFSIKYLQTKFNNTLKRLYNVIEVISFQGCRDGSTYVNQ